MSKAMLLSRDTDDFKIPLMGAATGGHVETINALLKYYPLEQVLATDKHGRTALMWAATGGHAPCINALLKHFPEQVVIADKDGRTALMWAAIGGHAPCINALLEHYPENQVQALAASDIVAIGQTSLDIILKVLAIKYKKAQEDGAGAGAMSMKECCEKLLALGEMSIDTETADALRGLNTTARNGPTPV